MFTFTRAVVRGIPQSIVAGGLRLEDSETPIDLVQANKQHQEYVKAVSFMCRKSFKVS